MPQTVQAETVLLRRQCRPPRPLEPTPLDAVVGQGPTFRSCRDTPTRPRAAGEGRGQASGQCVPQGVGQRDDARGVVLCRGEDQTLALWGEVAAVDVLERAANVNPPSQ